MVSLGLETLRSSCPVPASRSDRDLNNGKKSIRAKVEESSHAQNASRMVSEFPKKHCIIVPVHWAILPGGLSVLENDYCVPRV